jgi:CheY-like chemotaxis protein
LKTALIIEDCFEIRENLSEILELGGYNVIAVDNGEDGISTAVTKAPDFILCDIMMPHLNGYGVMNQIKNHPSSANIPFIFVTASLEKREMELALSMGADGYVRKPFDEKTCSRRSKRYFVVVHPKELHPISIRVYTVDLCTTN